MLQHKMVSLLMTIWVVIITGSCAGTPSTAGDYPPDLPPVSSVQITVADLHNDSVATAAENDNTSNFSRALTLMEDIDNQITTQLTVPVRLFKAAHMDSPVLNDRNQWEWSFTETVGGNKAPIRLTAERTGDNQVEWNMYIVNSQLGLADQLYIGGVTNGEGTKGQWTLYVRNGRPEVEKARFSWKFKGEKEVHKKLEIISDQNGNAGSYIEYSFDGKRKTVAYYNAGADDLAEVHRNLDSNVGYIFSPAFNDGHQACWDESYLDVLCSEV